MSEKEKVIAMISAKIMTKEIELGVYVKNNWSHSHAMIGELKSDIKWLQELLEMLERNAPSEEN